MKLFRIAPVVMILFTAGRAGAYQRSIAPGEFMQKTVVKCWTSQGRQNPLCRDAVAAIEDEFPPSEAAFPENEDIRDTAADRGKTYAATPHGLLVLDKNGGTRRITGKDGLPCEDVLAVDVRDGVAWVGTSLGAARLADGHWEYFQGRQYLADDRVVSVKVNQDGGAVLQTPGGASIVKYVEMTLEEKARHYENATRERHVRHALVSDSRLREPGNLSSYQLTTSDNDGLWTAMYIAAECYRYGATGDPQARRYARESLESLMFLDTVNGIPGFVSRSFARPDEPHGRGEWDHVSPDGKWRWKGDTSSDEIVGHFYAYSIYYDICADESEKEEIRGKVRLITDYIIENDYYLIDTDGEPTRWGKWNFLGMRRFLPARGLNSLELLSHLKTAYHLTGDEEYQNEYLKLALEHDYAKFTVRQKINVPSIINHSDDELAFLSYYPLLKYEKDPKLLDYYHRSIRRSWEIERPERCPLWNFIYGAVMPDDTCFDLVQSVDTLERMPLDLVSWDHVNSKRADVKKRLFHDRFDTEQSVLVLPPDERTAMIWNGNPYRLDDGKGGLREEAGTFWLLPYWMGRHYGFIE